MKTKLKGKGNRRKGRRVNLQVPISNFEDGPDPWGTPRMRKERFLQYVFFQAMARDLREGTTDTQMFMNFASRINATKIPPCTRNAAMVFLRFAGGSSGQEWKWMGAFEEAMAETP